MIRWTVEDGEIVINYGVTIIDRRNVKIVEFDLGSKYPGMVWYKYGAGQITVLIAAGERTLYLNDDHPGDPTRVTFTVPGSRWIVLADGVRYSLRVVIYREPFRIREWLRRKGFAPLDAWNRWRNRDLYKEQ